MGLVMAGCKNKMTFENTNIFFAKNQTYKFASDTLYIYKPIIT